MTEIKQHKSDLDCIEQINKRCTCMLRLLIDVFDCCMISYCRQCSGSIESKQDKTPA